MYLRTFIFKIDLKMKTIELYKNNNNKCVNKTKKKNKEKL